jgi:hypothetical protein
MPKEKKMSE